MVKIRLAIQLAILFLICPATMVVAQQSQTVAVPDEAYVADAGINLSPLQIASTLPAQNGSVSNIRGGEKSDVELQSLYEFLPTPNPPDSMLSLKGDGEPAVEHSLRHNLLSLSPYERGQDLAPEDAGVFRLPLIGELDEIGVRYATARGGFDGLTQQAVFATFRLPRVWSIGKATAVIPRIMVEAGRFELGSQHRAFASFGPTLRFASDGLQVPLFIDAGFSPTVIDGSIYDGKDFGTSLNFTSHIALGARLGRSNSQLLRLRFQHISNGGINDDNPGVNMIGLDFSFAIR